MGRIRRFFGKFKRSARDESGAVLVIVAVAITALIGFTALAVDMGLVYYQRSRLQTALDAAVLAAAYELPARTLDPGQLAIQQVKTEATVQQYLLKNGFEADDIKDLNVELLENNRIVRVTGHIDTEALFAVAVDVESIGSNGIAAAESAVKTIPFYFEHLVFQGASTRLDLLGAISTVNGSIHSNGSYYVDTHWTIQHIEGVNENYSDGSANTTGSSINTGTWGGAHVESHTDGVDYIEMPDWDSTLMDIATLPSAKTLPAVPSWPYTPGQHTWYSTSGTYSIYNVIVSNASYYYSWNEYDNGVKVGYKVPQKVRIVGDFSLPFTRLKFGEDVYFTGNVSTKYDSTLVFSGDVYIDGNLNPVWKSDVEVEGNLYVKGNLNFGGNGKLKVVKDLYVGGSFSSGATSNIYVGGSAYINGGADVTGTVTLNNLSVGGNAKFSCQGYLVTLNGDIYVNGKLDVFSQTSGFNVNKSLTVYGSGVASGGNAASFSGPTYLNNATVSINGSVETSGSGSPSFKMMGGVMYVAGNFLTTSGIRADGCIFVENNISFEGGETYFYQSPDSVVALYSRNGDILYTAAQTSAYGLVYAPKGKITLKGKLTFYGNLIADTLSISTGGLTIGQNTREMPFGLPSKTSTLVE